MKRLFCSCSLVALIGMTALVNAQSVPAGWTFTKDESGTCQVAHPADWKPETIGGSAMAGTTNDPKKLIRAIVLWEQDYKVDAMTIQVMSVKTVIENTLQRVFAETKVMKMPGPETRAFTVYVPAKPKGACHLNLSLYPGGSEELLKKVALTLAPAK
jgi:hypothetical protein